MARETCPGEAPGVGAVVQSVRAILGCQGGLGGCVPLYLYAKGDPGANVSIQKPTRIP